MVFQQVFREARAWALATVTLVFLLVLWLPMLLAAALGLTVIALMDGLRVLLTGPKTHGHLGSGPV